MTHITSTMSTDVTYTFYKKTPAGLPIPGNEITIKGGANVINKNLITREGVVTTINDDQLALLNTHPVFKRHLEAGYLKIHRGEKVDAKGLEEKDQSAQLTASDFTKQGKKAPKVQKLENNQEE